MSELLLSLAVLACPLGMGMVMWFMMRGVGAQHAAHPSAGDPAVEAELQLLRREVDLLRAAHKDARTEDGAVR